MSGGVGGLPSNGESYPDRFLVFELSGNISTAMYKPDDFSSIVFANEKNHILFVSKTEKSLEQLISSSSNRFQFCNLMTFLV